MTNNALFLTTQPPSQWVNSRPQEIKVGERITWLEAQAPLTISAYLESLSIHYAAGRRVALLGVPESIGPQANLGRGGAEKGWDAFQSQFFNLQYHAESFADELLVVGAVNCADLMAEAEAAQVGKTEHLRKLCAELDKRLIQILVPLFEQGFEVILIGGGHNNAYPLLHSLAHVNQQACAAVNLDPHSDFRNIEGRHSGNGFHYAYREGSLAYYHAVGLHEGKNSAANLQSMAQAGMGYHTIHDLYAAEGGLAAGFEQALAEVQAKVKNWAVPTGVELDLDAIQFTPASAYNTTGIPFELAYLYVYRLARISQTRYLHLAEAAPACHLQGEAAGMQQCGQQLSELVLAWLLAKQAPFSSPKD